MKPKKDEQIRIATEDEVNRYAPNQEPTANDPSNNPDEADGAEGNQEHHNPQTDNPADELTALREEVEQLRDKFLRARAETQNIARRAAQERQDAVLYGTADLLRALLDVVDDLERTIAAGQESQDIGPLLEGVKLVYEKLIKVLRDNQVQVIEAEGKQFDPNVHSAMMKQPSDRHEPGTVMQEVQRGYLLRDRVLRPSGVIVAAAPDNPAGDNPDTDLGAGTENANPDEEG